MFDVHTWSTLTSRARPHVVIVIIAQENVSSIAVRTSCAGLQISGRSLRAARLLTCASESVTNRGNALQPTVTNCSLYFRGPPMRARIFAAYIDENR
jgi:hypothetical protein